MFVPVERNVFSQSGRFGFRLGLWEVEAGGVGGGAKAEEDRRCKKVMKDEDNSQE